MLGLPLAFILSQDQTLHCKKFNLLRISGNLTFQLLRVGIPLSGGKVDFLIGFFRRRIRAAASSQRTFIEIHRRIGFFKCSVSKADGKCNPVFNSLQKNLKKHFQQPFAPHEVKELPSKGGAKVVRKFESTRFKRFFFKLFFSKLF